MEASLRREKEALRAALRRQAAGLPAAYLAASDAGIARRLRALEVWRRCRTLFIYVSVGAEPDTRALMEEAWAAGKRVCVPLCEGGGVMQARQIAAPRELRRGRYGLWEPDAAAPAVPPDGIDLIVAPCVAADERGYRLGHGGGYYDRYLKTAAGAAVCLCRGVLLRQALPRQAHDVPVGAIVTEDGVYPVPVSQVK